MTATHTPGPWSLCFWAGEDGHTASLGYGLSRGAKFHEEALASIYSDNLPSEEFDANARLIAAAPEMLDGLRCALTALENGEQTVECRGAQIIARAAIAKAEGQS